MPWFKIDDSAYFHPKIRRAGNAALGLWVRCGSFSAQHLLDGVVPGDTAGEFGTATQAAKLVAVGLWHSHGHTCPRCVQPGPGDYVIHDYFEGGRNSSRAQVEAARKASADRQAKSRAAAAGRSATPANGEKQGGNEPESGPNHTVNKVQTMPKQGPGATHFSDNAAGHDALSQRDDIDTVTTSQAKPSHTDVPPYGGTSSQQEPLDRIGDRPRIPEASRPLVEKLTAAGMVVGWDLESAEWFRIEAFIRKSGIDHLVVAAAEMWAKAKTRPRRGIYFFPGWTALPEVPAGTPVQPSTDNLPVVVGGTANFSGRPKSTSEHNADVIAAFRARHQEQQ
jgi:hypothetical protein